MDVAAIQERCKSLRIPTIGASCDRLAAEAVSGDHTTTNPPFSEWTKVLTNARLCKAILDRLTDRAHIVETGSERANIVTLHDGVPKFGRR